MSEKNYDIYLDLGSSKIRATAFDKQEKNQIFFLEKDLFGPFFVIMLIIK